MENTGFVQTRGATFNKVAENDFQIVTYETHKSKTNNKTVSKSNAITNVAKDERKGIDIKRARREIIKFGISGFDTQKKQEAKIALAVSLGAKPPKKEYKNYKKLLDEKKQQKVTDDSSKTLQQAGKNALGKSIAKKNFNNKKISQHKKMKGGLLEAYGKTNVKTTKNQPGFKPR